MQINTGLKAPSIGQLLPAQPKQLIANKTPKPTCFHNMKSQLYLSEDAPLSQRQSVPSQYSNLITAKEKPKIVAKEQIAQKKPLPIVLEEGGDHSEKTQGSMSSKNQLLKQSTSGKLTDKVIQHSASLTSNNMQSQSTQHRPHSQVSVAINQVISTPSETDSKYPKTARETDKKNLINLENVLLVEDKLWTILESFRYLQYQIQEVTSSSRPSLLGDSCQESNSRKQSDVAVLCEEWWEITHEDNLNYLDRLFKDDLVRRSVRQSIILELLSVTVCYALTSEKRGEDEANWLSQNLLVNLKSLFFYTHQNFLVLIDVIIHRLPKESSHNIWAHSLQAILLNKSSKKLLHSTNKGGGSGVADNAAQLLIANNEAIIQLLKSICKASKAQSVKTALNKPVVTCCLGLLKKLTKHSVSQIRELLFSILEQFTTNLLQKQQSQVINQKIHIVDAEDDQENDYLPVVYPPYLEPLTQRKQDKTYTLVLDLDETLIHYFEMGSEGGHFLVRPGAERFLKEMSLIYEVVIFTAAMQDYADWVLDQLDPDGCITSRLYRQHAVQNGGVFVKDLSRIGRDLSRTIIVDNVAENFQRQPDNGIFIRSWFDDMTDTALDELGPLLKEIVRKQVKDVRVALRQFRDQMIEQLERGIANPTMTLD